MNLEGLIGADPDSGEIHLEILAPLAEVILRDHSAATEDLRFSFFNALTLLGDYEVPEASYDHIDALLGTYIKTHRRWDQADTMLVDLLTDHYRCDRALRLIRFCLMECRVRERRDYLIYVLGSGIAVNDCVRAALPDLVDALISDGRPSRIAMGRRLQRAMLEVKR